MPKQRIKIQIIKNIIYCLISMTCIITVMYVNEMINVQRQETKYVMIKHTYQKAKHIISNEHAEKINIPSLYINYKIYQHYSSLNLNKGIVQQYAYQIPGKNTNYILAGHNLLYHHQFFTDLSKIKKNTHVFILTNKQKYDYIIKKVCYINTKDTYALNPTDSHGSITLYTCTNNDNQSKRFLAKGRLIHAEKK